MEHSLANVYISLFVKTNTHIQITFKNQSLLNNLYISFNYLKNQCFYENLLEKYRENCNNEHLTGNTVLIRRCGKE